MDHTTDNGLEAHVPNRTRATVRHVDDDSPMDSHVLHITCQDCRMNGTDACSDCLVTYLCARDPGDAVIVDLDEQRALRRLSASGLVPALRHVPVASME